MDALKQFSIPVQGLNIGIHQFEFQVDNEFFKEFENSPISEGNVDVNFEFDKRPDMYILTFDLVGSVKATCDRCLDRVDVIIDDTQNLMIKFSSTPSEEADIVHIPVVHTELNIAKYVYEYIILAMPITILCEESENSKQCNEEMLKYLDKDSTDDNQDSNPLWDELKKLKPKDN